MRPYLTTRGPAIDSIAPLVRSGYCLFKYSTMNPIGLDGFSISKLSTIAINNELMFLLFRYACSSACTSAAWWGVKADGVQRRKAKTTVRLSGAHTYNTCDVRRRAETVARKQWRE